MSIIGLQIEDYQIKSVLSEESMGTVYLAVHLPSTTQASVRLIHPQLADELFYQHLVKNTNALVSLNHPNIGKFYKYINHDHKVYLITEYTDGSTLCQYLAASQQPLSEERVWDICMQLIEVFDYAQTKSVSHFSLHAGNIRIAADGEVKVLDFGIASLFGEHFNKTLPEKQGLYQVQYASPDHVHGLPLDTRSDIYCLGIIFFELLTRQCAYPAVLSAHEIANKIQNHSLPPIKLYTKAFAHNYTMQAIVDKATAKNPDYRFQNFQELKESLLEEKDERETLTINQLMQEVNARSQLSASENISMIKLARKQVRKKRIGQSLLVLGLMAGAITLGMNIKIPVFKKSNISLQEAKDESDTGTDNSLITKESDDSAHSPANPPQTIRDKKEVDFSAKAPSSPEKPTQLQQEMATARAGFSIETNPASSFAQVQLQNRVEGFYAALQSKDLSQASEYYGPMLTHFFSENQVDQKKLQKLLLKAWKRTPEDKHEILWDTFQYSQDGEGNYTMEFYMIYVYRRANKNWRKRKIFTQIQMDKDLKIYAMSGD